MADTKTGPVVLVDGSSYLFRAFHALPPLTNSEGRQTGAIKGVISMLRRLVDQYPDSCIAVVFDAKGPTFRNEMYPDYKAHRPPMPEELAEQIEPIHTIVRALGLPLLSISGVEADDVIGTLARQATEHKLECIVSTGDKDMAQLVSEHVTLIDTMKNETLDIPGVNNKYGFPPERMIDYLALMGDKVDNIPGVPGVGQKTALALIQGLGGLDDIYANLDKVADLDFRGAKTMAAKLEEHRDQAYLSYELATIKLDVELDVTLNALAPADPDTEALLALYRQFEFKTWIRELTGENEDPAADKAAQQTAASNGSNNGAKKADSRPSLEAPKETDYRVLTSVEALESFLKEADASGNLALLAVRELGHYHQSDLVGLALAAKAGLGAYVPLIAEQGETLTEAQLWDAVGPRLASYAVRKTGYDFKSLWHVLNPRQLKASHLGRDTLLMAFVYDSTVRRDNRLSNHFSHLSLDNLFLQYLSVETKTIEDFLGKFGKRQLPIAAADPAEIGPWFAERADLTLRLGEWLDQGLSNRELSGVYEHIEQPLSKVLAEVEDNGTLLDTAYIRQLSHDFKARLAELEKQCHELAGTEFNLGSPKQLGEILFQKMELPVVSKTASGAPSTNEEVLTELSQQGYELPTLILQYRHLSKLVGTYTDPLPESVEDGTGRLHTSYNQTGAQTGRLSSTDPNLQNIPVRTEEGRSIRRGFVAPKGWKIVAADYSQIELRIMTHLSQDANLITAFREGRDIHRATAAEVMGLAEADVSSEQRRSAKAINFGLIYGMSAFGLAKQLNISRTDAQTYVNTYFERYPGVRRYMDETRAEAAETGYVETLYGRRLYLPDINAGKQMLRRAAERTAINAPMQGTAADIIKLAMVDVANWLHGSRYKARMVMQVHDELVFEVPEDELEAVCDGIRFRMQHCAHLDVPLIVDVGVGDSWEAAH
ncbi:DNA polymerase I [Saccharospirillum mangrovi]|uniref:DNA polymerase I n=1 Tax=Saccharospirillum mangrovi TaxID=2161747 RepID=UPI000D3B91C3|nr:DNA polymerase I [Saccharospirillum mangrovi]